MGDTRPLPQPLPRRASKVSRPSRTGTRGRRWLKRAALALAVLVVVILVAAATLWLITPSANEATQLAAQQASEHGAAFPGPAAPRNFTRPLIATEDHRFYDEPGVDPLALARIVLDEVTSSPDQGGATLDQQLAKLLYTSGSGQAGFGAKLKEFVVAVKLNLKFSKQQILDLYAEVAYYGHGYYGLEQASCGYFGHPAQDLTVVQGAMLAGVVNAPSIDDPVSDPVNARNRLAHVIARMAAVGNLTEAQGQEALRTPLGLVASGEAAPAQAGC